MNYKKKRANYNSNPNYLDYLTALQKFFTNNVDIIPIIMEFNFYVNGVFGIPYIDLFRSYDENMEDIHGTENTKSFIDDGTIGIINKQIYKANGNLLQSLEDLRVYLLDRSTKYSIVYNTFINAYAETIKPIVNNLPESNPVVIGGTKTSLPPKTKTKIAKKNPFKILFSKLSLLFKKK